MLDSLMWGDPEENKKNPFLLFRFYAITQCAVVLRIQQGVTVPCRWIQWGQNNVFICFFPLHLPFSIPDFQFLNQMIPEYDFKRKKKFTTELYLSHSQWDSMTERALKEKTLYQCNLVFCSYSKLKTITNRWQNFNSHSLFCWHHILYQKDESFAKVKPKMSWSPPGGGLQHRS